MIAYFDLSMVTSALITELSSQAVACTVWLIILPPHPVKNTAAQNVKIILECDEGSVVFICCIFAYDILLALLAFIFAFIARKLEDNLR